MDTCFLRSRPRCSLKVSSIASICSLATTPEKVDRQSCPVIWLELFRPCMGRWQNRRRSSTLARQTQATEPLPISWGTDTTSRCNAVQQLLWHAAAGNTAYEFEFARVPPGRESVGATHASELAHVFGTIAAVGVLGVGPPVRGTGCL